MNSKIETLMFYRSCIGKLMKSKIRCKYNNNQAYYGFIKGIQAVKDVIRNETLSRLRKEIINNGTQV